MCLVYFVSFSLFMTHLLFLYLSFFISGWGVYFGFSILSFGSFDVVMGFSFDFVSFFFSSFVLMISSLVFMYSGYYMSGDLFIDRFLYILFLFVGSMILLIFGMSFFSLMLGWDGLGLVSFCLVIYYSDKMALISGLVTVFMNRLGDGFILIGLYFFFEFGNWGFSFIYEGGLNVLIWLIFMGSITSSAQVPFSAWLPAAMAAPTPVSSLVHSSTLVTAGIYLSLRFYFFFSSFLLGWFFILISSLTMFGGGLLACFESDFKSIIAMSTLSQLGFMYFFLCIGEWLMTFYHLVCHALFKSLMFLSCGGYIHSYSGGQDSRLSGSFMLFSPYLSVCFIFSSFSLMGLPFLTGFYSSDSCLEVLFFHQWFILVYLIFFCSCVITVVYTLKLIFMFLCRVSLSLLVWGVSFNFFYVTSMFLLFVGSFCYGSFIGMFLLVEFYPVLSFPVSSLGLVLLFSGFLILLFISFGGLFTFFFEVIWSFFGLFVVSWGVLSYSYKKMEVAASWEYLWSELIGVGGFKSLIDSSFNVLIEFRSGLYWLSFIIFWIVISLMTLVWSFGLF